MAVLAVVGASIWGGGGIPDKPIITYQNQIGRFTITNYNPNLIYSFSVNSGSVTQTISGNSLTLALSSGDSTCTVSVYSQKRILGPLSTCTRKPYAYSCRTVSQSCGYGCNCRLQGGDCGCIPCSQGGVKSDQCGCYGPTTCTTGSIGEVVCDTCYYDCSYQVCDVLINQTGNGYINNGSEWYKIT
jgi:hypothetical protein